MPVLHARGGDPDFRLV